MSGEGDAEPEEPKNILKMQMIMDSLSQVDNTSGGDTYAFTTLILEEKELEVLGDDIKNYVHLRNISLCKNQLKSINELSGLHDLLFLKATENLISDISYLSQDVNPYLQVLVLNQNKIKSLPPITPPLLRHLNLNENEIETWADFTGHQKIELLELRKNKIRNCDGLGNMPRLNALYLGENPLASISQLHTMTHLKRLHLRAWEIEAFDLVPDLPSLEYLNLRETKIASIEQIKKLEVLSNLKNLNLISTPLTEELGENIKKEVILALEDLSLEKINKSEVTQGDIREAQELKQERIREEEEKRKAAEAKEGEGEAEGADS